MKRFFLYILSLLLPLSVCAEIYTQTISFNVENLKIEEFKTSNGSLESRIILDELTNSGPIGEPNLPMYSVLIALPNDARDITITSQHLEEPTNYDCPFPIEAVKKDTPTTVINIAEDKIEYNKGQTYPSSHFILNVESYKDLYKIAQVCLVPCSYNPENNSLTAFRNLTFTIEYNTDNNPLSNYRLKPRYVHSTHYQNDLAVLRSIVNNPEAINDFSHQIPNPINLEEEEEVEGLPAYEYTIVTTHELADSFLRLVALKRLKGLDAGIVCIEDILSAPEYSEGDLISNINDDAGKLKAYFMANQDVIRFILLGGHPPLVPMRYGRGETSVSPNDPHIEEEIKIPTDLYFGTGINSNWNTIGDGTYGHRYSGFSYSSIFNIGRLLCKTAQDVNNYLDKLEIYEMNPGLGDASYLHNAYTHLSNFINANVDFYHVFQYLNQDFEHVVSISTNATGHSGNQIINEINETKPLFPQIRR